MRRWNHGKRELAAFIAVRPGFHRARLEHFEEIRKFDCPGGRRAPFRGTEAAQNTGQNLRKIEPGTAISRKQFWPPERSDLGRSTRPPTHVAIKSKPAKLQFRANKPLFN
jgi:hypothetical protein